MIMPNTRFYRGSKSDLPIPDGGSHWFKQNEIHQSTHAHGCPAFRPWHREIVNGSRTRSARSTSQLSLPYWDCTEDPEPLTIPDLMGTARGSPEAPGFYDPHPSKNRDTTLSPADPPTAITRQVAVSGPLVQPAVDQDMPARTGSVARCP
ncbi:tyrosinase family protein [Kitasatospora sp. NPDC059646]|uniref:tyrosinase family protein n=1 Tax=Kitasatospora sp. NPDC059646 TaxID=3346893 RepID=UPI00368FDF78